MKKIIVIFLCLLLTGCATLQLRMPDGTEVNYTRFATTSDNISGQIGNARVESTGQRIDVSKVIKAATDFLKALQ